jgi:ABC-type cobalamin transport system permease subunit
MSYPALAILFCAVLKLGQFGSKRDHKYVGRLLLKGVACAILDGALLPFAFVADTWKQYVTLLFTTATLSKLATV